MVSTRVSHRHQQTRSLISFINHWVSGCEHREVTDWDTLTSCLRSGERVGGTLKTVLTVFFSEKFMVRLNKNGGPKNPEKVDRLCALFTVTETRTHTETHTLTCSCRSGDTLPPAGLLVNQSESLQLWQTGRPACLTHSTYTLAPPAALCRSGGASVLFETQRWIQRNPGPSVTGSAAGVFLN